MKFEVSYLGVGPPLSASEAVERSLEMAADSDLPTTYDVIVIGTGELGSMHCSNFDICVLLFSVEVSESLVEVLLFHQYFPL